MGVPGVVPAVVVEVAFLLAPSEVPSCGFSSIDKGDLPLKK